MNLKNIMKNKKSITVKNYFNIIHPKYSYLRIIPDTSIRNYNSENIAKAICTLYRNTAQRLSINKFRISYNFPEKVSFIIDIYTNEVNFYLIVPEQYEGLLVEKCVNTWSKCTIQKVNAIPNIQDEALKNQLAYKKEDALSLKVDKKWNEPLNSILNVCDIMNESDRVCVYYNFLPINMLYWKNDHINTIEKIKNSMPIDRTKLSISYCLKMLAISTMKLFDTILEVISDFTGSVSNKQPETAISAITPDTYKRLSTATRTKGDKPILGTQIIVASESRDKIRKKNNLTSVCESYKTLSEDNYLTYKPLNPKSKIEFNKYKIKAETNITSVDECKNFIEIPGRDLLNQFKNIQKIDVQESQIPGELKQGIMCIGENTYKGQKQKAFLSTDKDYKFLTLCLIAPTRAGKTTLISNLSKDGTDNKECMILFDFCGNCELSDDVSSMFPNEKVLNIDCSKFETLQGLGYNEITPLNNNPFEVYRCAKAKTSQLMTLINSINSEDTELKARMERFLECAALIVFISDGSIKDVIGVLQDHKLRHKYIDLIPLEQKENLSEYVMSLEELDEWSKVTKDNPDSEIVGTKTGNTQGILNRINKLKQNTYMELMLKKDCTNNINLVMEMQKPQIICIRMPEIMFSTESEKDSYCTYWVTKIWGALQKRKWDTPENDKRVKVNIVIDELSQVPNCQEFLRSKLSQIAKFSCKPIISCHYLGQINNIRNELKAANSSYILIQGCDKDNFKELREELDPYELEDLLHLKRYHALCLIRYEKGYGKFITKLPPPIK